MEVDNTSLLADLTSANCVSISAAPILPNFRNWLTTLFTAIGFHCVAFASSAAKSLTSIVLRVSHCSLSYRPFISMAPSICSMDARQG